MYLKINISGLMVGFFSLFRSQLRCYLLSETILTTQVCRSLLLTLPIFSPWNCYIELLKHLTQPVIDALMYLFTSLSFINPQRE